MVLRQAQYRLVITLAETSLSCQYWKRNIRFYKAGGAYGALNFDKVTGNRTYNYPNWNGDVIISTTGGLTQTPGLIR